MVFTRARFVDAANRRGVVVRPLARVLALASAICLMASTTPAGQAGHGTARVDFCQSALWLPPAKSRT